MATGEEGMEVKPGEPPVYAWIVPDRVAVAERPGGGGRTHRVARRAAELAWWRERGVTAIVSGMRTRHGLRDYEALGLSVRWHPLTGPEQAREELPRLVSTVRALAEAGSGAVLVHCDLPGEWLTAVDAALRLGLGRAEGVAVALAGAAGDGLPVGSLASSLVRAPAPASG